VFLFMISYEYIRSISRNAMERKSHTAGYEDEPSVNLKGQYRITI